MCFDPHRDRPLFEGDVGDVERSRLLECQSDPVRCLAIGKPGVSIVAQHPAEAVDYLLRRHPFGGGRRRHGGRSGEIGGVLIVHAKQIASVLQQPLLQGGQVPLVETFRVLDVWSPVGKGDRAVVDHALIVVPLAHHIRPHQSSAR